MLRAEQAAKNKSEVAGKGKVYSLGSYTEQQKINWHNSKRIITYENEEQFVNFIDESVKNLSYDQKMYFGTIGTELANIIQEKTEVSVTGYNLSLSSQEIRKILRDHGDAEKEALRGQRAATKADFANIPNVVQSPDPITLFLDLYNGKPVILFTKNLGEKNTIVAVVSDKHHDLFVQTAYFGAKKESLASPLDTKLAPNTTSETPRGTAFNNTISDSTENVNGNVSYSAKKPEIIDVLQADYGYSEASANNIYRAARTLKQNTGSKADIEQLTTEIVTSLENRRNGEIDSDNINRIAMMLAENTQAVNETYVSEYKPIKDYPKGTKISILETDIADLILTANSDKIQNEVIKYDKQDEQGLHFVMGCNSRRIRYMDGILYELGSIPLHNTDRS